jgi:hypothetical protein
MKVLNLQPMQEHAIQNLYKDVCTEILKLAFTDPAKDHQVIRQHAYLAGKKAVLNFLLDDEWPAPDIELPVQNQQF